jgi:hypothetical protein
MKNENIITDTIQRDLDMSKVNIDHSELNVILIENSNDEENKQNDQNYQNDQNDQNNNIKKNNNNKKKYSKINNNKNKDNDCIDDCCDGLFWY